MFAYYEQRVKKIAFESTVMENGRLLDCAPHIHPHIEIVYIKDGKTTCGADMQEYEAEPDDLFVSFPNQVHYYKGGHKHAFSLFIIDPEYIPDFYEIYGNKIPQVSLIKNISQYPTMKALLDTFSREYTENDESNEIVLKGLIYAFLGEIYYHSVFIEQILPEENSLKSVIKYCPENFKSNITLEILEKEIHLNKYYISHLFSDKFKISFTEYVNLLRLTEACKLLANTKMTISKISAASGFNTTRTFNRAFMKKFGMSPIQYRNSISNTDKL